MSRFVIDHLYDKVFGLFARKGEHFLHPKQEERSCESFFRAVEKLQNEGKS